MGFHRTANKVFKASLKNPKGICVLGKAFIRGCFYALYYHLFKKNIRIKLPFMVYSRVSICGPGIVFIDSGCSVFANAFDGLTIITLATESQVRIGKGCDLGGMTIRCRNKVIIGDRAMSANCLVQDTPFFMAKPANLPVVEIADLITPNGIHIGERVWLTSQAIVLYGSKIGDGSVLSTGSVCRDIAVPERHLVIGNPMLTSISIDRINTFLGR